MQQSSGRLATGPPSARSREWGIGTIEILVVFSLLGFAFVSIIGLHRIAVSTGTAAETSSIATNLARARLEALLSLPPAQILAQDNTQLAERVPAAQGRVYTIRTAVDSSKPARLDITVTVTWDVAFGAACAGGPAGGCTGRPVTFTRTLQTRIRRS
jgi:Tfp pilus assembly protein PilV